MVPLVKVGLPLAEILMPELQKVLYSGHVAEGEYVYEFEKNFAARFKQNNLLAMSSGTAALHISLLLCGAGPGTEVISTPMTAEPTNTSIYQTGAKVVWADVDPLSGNIDPNSIRQKITQKTKAIMIVHYAGYPVRMAEIMQIGKEFNIPVIEDCAHALGAKYLGQDVGVFGDYSIFSFQAIKHMTTVDGGAFATKHPEQLIRAKKMRWFGMLKGVPRTELDLDSIGFKYNMSNVTAVIGNSQLKNNVDSVLNAHIQNGLFFDKELDGATGLNYARCDQNAEASYWLYTLLCDNSDEVEKALIANGISASKLHRPNHLHSLFKESMCDLPGLDLFYKRLLHIPCGWWVDEATREKIVKVLRKG